MVIPSNGILLCTFPYCYFFFKEAWITFTKSIKSPKNKVMVVMHPNTPCNKTVGEP